MSPQLPLSLKFSPDQRFDAFVGPDGPRLLAEAVADGAGSDWGFIAGMAGSGKTHLLLAACAVAGERGQPGRYLPLRALKGRLGPALEDLPADGLACVDDVEAIAGIRDDEVALFHLHNRMRAGGGRILYAAGAMPSRLALSLPDLVTRLEQCARVVLQPLDDEARREVLRRRAQRRGLELDDGVLDYLMRRVGRDLAGLTRWLDRLDRESLAAKRRVTMPFLRDLLSGD